jgi:23S rRNA (uracil1939-C5)-methyltransferase
VTEHLVVTSVGHRGDGVVATPEGAVYVPQALPGEAVEVDSVPGHPDRRRLLRVERESPERIAPICRHFGTCGGCAVQHWRTPQYQAWKRDLVAEALALAGIEACVEPLVDAHGVGRRRAVLHARSGSHDVLAVGFAAQRAHHIVAIDDCPILARAMHGVIETAWAIAEALAPLRKPLDIQATAANEGLDLDVRGSGPLRPEQVAGLAQIAMDGGLARITRHGEIVAQRVAPTITIGRAQVPLPAGAFLQPTAAGETTLARLVVEAAGTARNIADLFCGIGPFALRLAEHARVVGVDSDTPAIAALARATATTPGLKPIEGQARDLFRRPLLASELARFDAVVFDPPRQGAQAQARELAASTVPIVVAVSCNPATFARDANILVDGGYRLTRITPVDQFRYSPHVEIVASFAR